MFLKAVPRASRLRASLAIVAVLTAHPGGAAEAPVDKVVYRVIPGRSGVTFTMKATLHTVHGKTEAVSGEFSLPQKSAATGFPVEGRVVIDARTLNTGNRSRDRKMKAESLAVGRYPDIVFTPSCALGSAPAFTPGTTAKLTLQGDLTIRGVTKPVSMAVTCTFQVRTVSVDGSTNLSFLDYAVPDPSTFLLRVDPHVSVSFHLEGEQGR